MRYMITGRHRTGTSMMMRAVAESSGLVPVVDLDSEQAVRQSELDPDSYNPNPHGYFHAGWGVDYLALPDETLVKANLQELGDVTFENFRIIQMVRPEEQRRASFAQAFGIEFNNQIAAYEKAEENLSNYPNLIVVNYVDMFVDPLATFSYLQHCGWPINPEVAVSTVDPSLFRHRS